MQHKENAWWGNFEPSIASICSPDVNLSLSSVPRIPASLRNPREQKQHPQYQRFGPSESNNQGKMSAGDEDKFVT